MDFTEKILISKYHTCLLKVYVLNFTEAKEYKYSSLRNHNNSPKKKFSTLAVQEVMEKALKYSTKMVVKAKPKDVSCIVGESSVGRTFIFLLFMDGAIYGLRWQ